MDAGERGTVRGVCGKCGENVYHLHTTVAEVRASPEQARCRHCGIALNLRAVRPEDVPTPEQCGIEPERLERANDLLESVFPEGIDVAE